MAVLRHIRFAGSCLRVGLQLSFALLVVTPDPTNSQTKWFKYEGNPVLEVSPPGSWKSTGVLITRVILRDSVLHAWHAANDGTYRRVGYMTSRDGIHWTADSGNPVLDLGAEGTWDHREATMPYVTVAASKYHMWYQGYDGVKLRIGYAISPDGKLWTKHTANPALMAGPSTWDGQYVGFPSVLGPHANGRYQMWYSGNEDTAGYHIQIGLAMASNPTFWEKYPGPVLPTGSPGSWDDRSLIMHRVLRVGRIYEMWYAGSRGVFSTSQTGYATSPDGIHWTKDPGNPVLLHGPVGSWDDQAAFIGDVLFDGSMYRMWYGGFDGSVVRTGYAISPKGTEVNVSADRIYVVPGRDSVLVSVRVNDPLGLSFSAEFQSKEKKVDSVELFDDGVRGAGVAADGLFANRWLPTEEGLYSVNLTLKVSGKDDLRFEMKNAGLFTTIGPITIDEVQFVDDVRPIPGDTVILKVALRNHGSLQQADSVSASISTREAWITEITPVSLVYGTIVPGGNAATDGYYRMLISPNCPVDTDIPFDVHISSAGVSLWRDSFVIRVLPPWWRTNWAYGLYAVVVVGLFYGIQMRRMRSKHQREMQRFEMEKLKEVDQLKSRFFANISHEFRTPLTLIEGPAKQLLEHGYTGNRDEAYQMIVRNTQRLQQLVNQLLDLSKIESGQMKLRAHKANTVDVVRGVAAAFESLAKRKGIEFRIDCPDESIIGWFDRDVVEKIITNLLSNAFKFTARGGSVIASVERTQPPHSPFSLKGKGEGGISSKMAIITISDTGIGMPHGQLGKIFDRFYQVDQSQTKEYEGTGIGLALTKDLVELHHGEIRVASELGKGSTFTVRLPLGEEYLRPGEILKGVEEVKPVTLPTVEGTEPFQEEIEGESDEKLPLVLLVEDNADMRRYMRTHLESAYRLLEATNGEEGVQTAFETIPDLIISDVMMPKTDGFELCKRLKTDERTSHIPTILLTAKAAAEHKLEGLQIGADDYVIKPFDARELLARVKNLIDQRRKLREKFQRELVLQPKDVTVQSVDATFLKKTIAVIESHLSDPGFDTTAFAAQVAMSRMQLHRKLRALTNLGPGELIRSFRMKHAASLLQQNAGNISEIAYEVGYNNPSYFAKVFREYFGVAPSEYPRHQQTQQR